MHFPAKDVDVQEPIVKPARTFAKLVPMTGEGMYLGQPWISRPFIGGGVA